MGMIGKLEAAWSVFQKGKAVADPVTWKQNTVAVNAMVGFIGAVVGLARAFGYDLAVDDQTLGSLAAGIVAAVSVGNSVVHVVTDHRMGMQSGGGDPSGTGASAGRGGGDGGGV